MATVASGCVARARDTAFDWNRYWSEGAPSAEVIRGGKQMARRITRWIQEQGLHVDSMADVGCGPAIMLFELARAMPNCRFQGFDSSRAIIARNQSRARRERLANLHFGYARLPRRPYGTYDVVTCIATLHYMSRPRTAIQALYRLVNEGGFLVFNYPNRLQRAAYIRASRTDPTVATRFALVLSGKNLLTRDQIETLVGQRPRNFWASVHEPPMRTNPCVMVGKGNKR